jgi:hypothetical protein
LPVAAAGPGPRFGTWPVAGLVVAGLGGPLLAVAFLRDLVRPGAKRPPAGYQAYAGRGGVVRTGNATLDYWVALNLVLDVLNRPSGDPPRPGVLWGLAAHIRRGSTDGVYPDLAGSAARVADLLEAQAGILGGLHDPATVAGPTRKPRWTR